MTDNIMGFSKLDELEFKGYKVKYQDGYESWSPVAAFEAAYRLNGSLNYGDALHLLKEGQKVRRSGWNGKGLHVELQTPDENSKMTMPYLYLVYPAMTGQKNPLYSTGAKIPWVPSQSDQLAEDWEYIEA